MYHVHIYHIGTKLISHKQYTTMHVRDIQKYIINTKLLQYYVF